MSVFRATRLWSASHGSSNDQFTYIMVGNSGSAVTMSIEELAVKLKSGHFGAKAVSFEAINLDVPFKACPVVMDGYWGRPAVIIEFWCFEMLSSEQKAELKRQLEETRS